MRSAFSILAAISLLGLATQSAAQVDPGSITSREITRQVSNAAANESANRVIRPTLTVRGESAASLLGGDSTGRFAAVALANNEIGVWDVDRGQQIARLTNAPRRLSAIGVGADGRTVIVATGDGAVSLVTPTGQRALGTGAAATALALSDDGRAAAIARGAEIAIVDASSGAVSARFSAGEPIVALTFSADGQSVRALGARGRFVTLNTSGALASERRVQAPELAYASIAPDGRRGVGQDARGGVYALNLEQGTSVATSARVRVRAGVGANSNSNLSLLISAEGRVQMWSLSQNLMIAQLISTPRGWAVMDHEGRFDGSNDALADVVWQEGPSTYDLSGFAARYFEPGVLGRYVRGQESTMPAVQAVSEGVAPPPSLEIVLPDELPKVAGRDYQLVVLATDAGGGVDAVRLYHNGRLVDRTALVQAQDITANGRRVRASVFHMTPTSGPNSFRAAAVSRDNIEGYSERVSANFSGPPEQATQHVLVVGVDDYQELPDLNFAVADASGVANYFNTAPRGSFTNRQVRTLTNAQATKAGVLAAIRDIAQRSRPADVIVVYLAGHGFARSREEWRFAPSGASLQSGRVNSTTISAAELQDALTAAQARRVMLMIDACQSTAAFGAFVDQRDFYRRFFSDLSRTSGFAVLSAARSNAEAFELRSLGHGAFTYVVLQGLQGGADRAPSDGSVMVQELSNYVERELPDVVLRHERVNQEAGVFVLGTDFTVR